MPSNASEKTQKNIPANLNRWLAEGERGISSEAIASQLTGIDFVGSWKKFGDYPHDPSDFRRCLMLLSMVPEFKSRLPEMKERHPIWANLIENWDRLEDLYWEEVHTGKCPKLYEEMKKLGA